VRVASAVELVGSDWRLTDKQTAKLAFCLSTCALDQHERGVPGPEQGRGRLASTFVTSTDR
jgi:hypothetical protein